MSLTLKEKVKTVFYFLTHPQSLKMVISLEESGYLHDEGWFKAFNMKQAIDKNGNPIPWFTYPSIDFIKERLNKEMTVFEYGCGNSTLFFAMRVKEITSVEKDRTWYGKIKQKLPSNASIILFKEAITEVSYTQIIERSNKKFDLIIVDAIKRNEVIYKAVDYIKPDGVIILDNSDVSDYKAGIEFLIKKGFKRLDFWGIQAGYFNKTCTTIFYKSNNCLGI